MNSQLEPCYTGPMEIIGRFNVDCSEFMNTAERTDYADQTTELTLAEGSLDVHVEGSGSAYSREETRTFIPIEVIIRMLEHAGYTVSRASHA